MNYYGLLGGLFAASLATAGHGATFSVADAVAMQGTPRYETTEGRNPDDPGGELFETVGENRFSTLRGASGFEFQNVGSYGLDCSGDSITQYNDYEQYSSTSCGNSDAVYRSDGGTFSIDSLDVSAEDFRLITASDPFRDGQYQFLDTYTDDPEQLAIIEEYLEWRAQSEEVVSEDRFYAVGYRDGQEVVRQNYGETGGRTSVELSGFSDLDAVVFGFTPYPFFTNDWSFLDAGYYTVLGPDQQWCVRACEQVNIYGFEYSLNDTAVAPVPLPASLQLLLAGLGGLAFARRKMSRASKKA